MYNSPQPTDAYAVYGHVDYRVDDQWKLIAELRDLSSTRKTANKSTKPRLRHGIIPESCSSVFSPVFWKLDSNLVTGKVSANYTPSNDVLFDGSVSRGAKSGGFWGGLSASPLATRPYQPETNLAFEVGEKSDLFENTLRLNASAFDYEISNYQAPALFSVLGAEIDAVTNVGTVRDYGYEANFEWVPDDRWSLYGAIGTARATIVSSTLMTDDAFATGLLHPLQNTNVPNYSKFTSQLGARYVFPLENGFKVDVGADYEYRSSNDLQRIVYAPEAGIFREPGYGLLNVQAGVSLPGDAWRLSAYANNVTDVHYRSTADVDGVGGLFQIYGLPTTWGVRLQTKF